jgi:hypothetical protein
MTTGYSLQATDATSFSELVKETISNGISFSNYAAKSGYSPVIGDVVCLDTGEITPIVPAVISPPSAGTENTAMGIVTGQHDAANAKWQVVDFGAAVKYEKLNYNGGVEATATAALLKFGIKVI